MSTTTSEPTTLETTTEWLEVIRKSVSNLRYGSIQITIHEGRVTQIESIEKTRFITPREDKTGKR